MDDTSGKTLSSLIVAEKSRPKPGGCVGIFFQLFDWNRRFAKKKLFSNRFILGAKTKKAPKFRDDKLPMAKLLLVADENKGGCPDAKRSVCSNHCSSICAEWKHRSIHSPGIVGRLMGLDTMPAVGSSQTNVLEPHQSNTRRKLSESLDGDPYPEVRKKLVAYRPQKLQITGIIEGRHSVKSESFPFRTMVSRSRKHHHHHHQKLMYPVRNSSSHHGRNTVRLMDAATKILEPGFLATSRSKCTLPCPTKPLTPADGISTTEVIYNNISIPECEKWKTNADEQETLEFSAPYADVNVGDIQNSAEMKLNPWVPVHDLEQGTANESEFGKTGIVKNEEWFRVNSNVKSGLQRMEGNYEVMNSRKPCDGGHDLVVSTRKMNCQKCEDKHIKIGPPPNVLKLKNQKERQVLMVKDGWRENATPCIKYTRRCSSCQAPKGTTVSHRSLSKPIQTRTYTRQVNQCDATLNERGVKKRCNFDKEDDPLLRANTLHCKKKTNRGNSNDGIMRENVYSNERTRKLSTLACNSVGSRAHASQNNINRRWRHAQPEHGITNNAKREMHSSVTQTDAISFTFTSPMRSSSRNSKKTDKDHIVVYGASNRLNGAYHSPHNSFLQKKMLSSTHSRKSVAHACVENIKALSGFPSESKYGDSTAAGSDVKARTSKHTSVNDSIHQSPVSILDVSFSNESCFSSEGYDGCRGNVPHRSCSGCSPVRSEKYVVDMELIDSATSRNNSNQWGDSTVDTSCSLMYRISDSTGTLVEDACPPTSEKLQVDYIKRILSNIKLSFDNIALFGVHHSCFAVPCLFEKLESLMIGKHSKGTGCMSDFVRTEGYHKRRLIFDFVMNYMALKFHPYSQSRFGALNKLPMLVSHERLSREISEEVMSLQILQGSVLDEIVEWEMNTQLSEWMDLEIEVFETAVDIEKCILRNLVTEAILDVLQIKVKSV